MAVALATGGKEGSYQAFSIDDDDETQLGIQSFGVPNNDGTCQINVKTMSNMNGFLDAKQAVESVEANLDRVIVQDDTRLIPTSQDEVPIITH